MTEHARAGGAPGTGGGLCYRCRRPRVDQLIAERLSILSVSPTPASPPRAGAQARIHGLLIHMARRHEITAITLCEQKAEAEEHRRAMREYCSEVIVLPNPRGKDGLAKRALQLRAAGSLRSYEHHRFAVPALQAALDRVLRQKRFDVINLEFPYLAHFRLRQSPPGTPPPPLVIDAHEIAYDIARQFARNGQGLARRVHAGLNWRKLRREEIAAFRAADGICVCSVADQQRLLEDVPAARTAVVPNAADVEYYQPRPSDPPPDGRTVVFFGLLSTFPNLDGVGFFVREIWPRIVARRPDARCRIIGRGAPPSIQALAGPQIEITGLVSDLRPYLASAAALVVPLRIGGGTRLKIVEGMAMARPIVSTTLGAEGIDAVPERDILIADDGEAFAAAVLRLLGDPGLGARLGGSARKLAVEKYAWSSAADTLERLYREVIAARSPAREFFEPTEKTA